MWSNQCFMSILMIINLSKSTSMSGDLPSVFLESNNRDDNITQIFNQCKCVIFYLCDEQNYIIPFSQLQTTQVAPNYYLRGVKRITCSNTLYFCCKSRNQKLTTPVTSEDASIITSTVPPIQQSTFICGRRNWSFTRPIDEFPWLVAIFEKRGNRDYSFKCGGAIIHPKVVLTAQHCIRSNMESMLKITTQSDTVDPNSRYAGTVSKIIKHDQYNSGALYNDIALLILPEPFYNSPVCLPQTDHKLAGKRCIALGWKVDMSLQKIDLPIVDFQSCQDLLRGTKLGGKFTLHQSSLCAGGEEGTNTCQEGGGGPLICKNGGSYVQVGITSWNMGCGQSDVPGVYVDVFKLKSWIDDELRKENLSLVYS